MPLPTDYRSVLKQQLFDQPIAPTGLGAGIANAFNGVNNLINKIGARNVTDTANQYDTKQALNQALTDGAFQNQSVFTGLDVNQTNAVLDQRRSEIDKNNQRILDPLLQQAKLLQSQGSADGIAALGDGQNSFIQQQLNDFGKQAAIDITNQGLDQHNLNKQVNTAKVEDLIATAKADPNSVDTVIQSIEDPAVLAEFKNELFKANQETYKKNETLRNQEFTKIYRDELAKAKEAVYDPTVTTWEQYKAKYAKMFNSVSPEALPQFEAIIKKQFDVAGSITGANAEVNKELTGIVSNATAAIQAEYTNAIQGKKKEYGLDSGLGSILTMTPKQATEKLKLYGTNLDNTSRSINRDDVRKVRKAFEATTHNVATDKDMVGLLNYLNAPNVVKSIGGWFTGSANSKDDIKNAIKDYVTAKDTVLANTKLFNSEKATLTKEMTSNIKKYNDSLDTFTKDAHRAAKQSKGFNTPTLDMNQYLDINNVSTALSSAKFTNGVSLTDKRITQLKADNKRLITQLAQQGYKKGNNVLSTAMTGMVLNSFGSTPKVKAPATKTAIANPLSDVVTKPKTEPRVTVTEFKDLLKNSTTQLTTREMNKLKIANSKTGTARKHAITLLKRAIDKRTRK